MKRDTRTAARQPYVLERFLKLATTAPHPAVRARPLLGIDEVPDGHPPPRGQ